MVIVVAPFKPVPVVTATLVTVPVLVVYPAPFVNWLLLVGIVVDVNALEPKSLVPITLEPFIIKEVVSDPWPDRPVSLSVDNSAADPLTISFFQLGIFLDLRLVTQ